MNQPDEKTLARMRKLLELAQRGVGGEAENATRFLERLLARHGMSVTDIIDDVQKRTPVTLRWKSPDERALLLQILSKVLDMTTIPTWQIRGRKVIIVELTPGEHAEVIMHHAALLPALEQHMKIAMNAFVQVNELYPPSSVTAETEPPSDPQLRGQLLMMMAASRRTAVNKALPQPAEQA